MRDGPHDPLTGRLGKPLIGVVAWSVVAFLIVPLLVVIPLSLTSGTLLTYPLPGLSFRWYAEFLGNSVWLTATRNSLALAFGVTLLATPLGTLAAFGLVRPDFPFRQPVTALLLTPLLVPLIIVAVASFLAFSRIGLTGGYLSLLLAHTALALPFVVITVLASLRTLDPWLERAAATLGAMPAQTFRRVTLPLILPGVASGALFAFVTSFDEVVVALFLGGPEFRTLPRQIWSGVRESITPTVTAAAVLLVLLSLLAMAAVECLRRHAERTRTAGSGGAT